VGGAWGSKEARRIKLDEALRREQMALPRPAQASKYPRLRATLGILGEIPLLRNIKHVPHVLGILTQACVAEAKRHLFSVHDAPAPQVVLVFSTVEISKSTTRLSTDFLSIRSLLAYAR
jgi:hypothetical protein